VKDFVLECLKGYKIWWWHLYEDAPLHIFVETGLLLFIVWLVFIRKTIDPTKSATKKLSEDEVKWLVDTWNPEPLAPVLDERTQRQSASMRIVDAVKGNVMSVRGIASDVLNLCSYDFIGSSQYATAKDAAKEALYKYGCGSCGPRGFYGTIDVHLDLEAAVAKFMGTEEAIYYSDGASTVSSAIPAFSKRGDLLIVDEGCCDSVRIGVELSRSTVITYRHNDMADLRKILQSIADDDKRLKRDTLQQRRFIVCEGLYRITGDICPLPEIMKLKEEFFYRLILDESTSFGVMGATGRGITEHFDINIGDIEVLTISLDTTLCSVGGLCVGSHEIVDHQRLSGAGYCFSAAAPPFLSSAAVASLKRLEDKGETLMFDLNKNSLRLKNALKKIKNFQIASDFLTAQVDGEDTCGDWNSPIMYLSLIPSPNRTWEEDETMIHQLCEMCLERGVGLSTLKFSTDRLASLNKELIRPSLRICASTYLKAKEITHAVGIIKECAATIRARQ